MPFMEDNSYQPWHSEHPFNNIPELQGKTDLEKQLFWTQEDLTNLANKYGDLQRQINSIKTQGNFE